MFKKIHPAFIVLFFGVFGLLAIVVLNDVYRSITRNQPISYDVVVLIKMAVAAFLGMVAGYLAKQDKEPMQ